MRSWRSEALSTALVLAVPAWIAAIFPYPAFRFRALPRPQRMATPAALVTLSESEEEMAVKAAQSSLRGVGRRVTHVNLAIGELPADNSAVEVLPLDDRGRVPAPARVELAMPAFLPSQAAEAPKPIAAEPDPATLPVFKKEDLLKID